MMRRSAFIDTVELRSKGPGRKETPSIWQKISNRLNHFPIHFYIGYKRIKAIWKKLRQSHEIPWWEVPL